MSNNISTGDISVENNSNSGKGSVGVSLKNGTREGVSECLTTVVPLLVHESALAREERHTKRLVIALIVSVLTLFLTNIGWLFFMGQYSFESAEISSEGGGNANYIGEDGNIYNGSYQGAEND